MYMYRYSERDRERWREESVKVRHQRWEERGRAREAHAQTSKTAAPAKSWQSRQDPTQPVHGVMLQTSDIRMYIYIYITPNTMLRGLHRYSLHEFHGPASPHIDQITFIAMACEEYEKMKKRSINH